MPQDVRDPHQVFNFNAGDHTGEIPDTTEPSGSSGYSTVSYQHQSHNYMPYDVMLERTTQQGEKRFNRRRVSVEFQSGQIEIEFVRNDEYFATEFNGVSKPIARATHDAVARAMADGRVSDNEAAQLERLRQEIIRASSGEFNTAEIRSIVNHAGHIAPNARVRE